MNVLVTGVAGFIGSTLATELSELHNIIGLDFDTKYSLGCSANIPDGITYYHTDICDTESVAEILDKEKIDLIYHLAAISDTRVTDEDYMYETNTHASIRLIEEAVKRKIALVFASSASVYGNDGDTNNLYAKSKLAVDRYIFETKPDFVTSVRFFNVYGANEGCKGKTASMVYQILNSDDKVIKLFKGKPERDFIHVYDVIFGLMHYTAREGIYDIGTGKPEPFEHIVEYINEHTDRGLEIEYIDNPYPRESYQSYTKAKTNMNCIYNLKFGIKAVIDEMEKK